MKGHVQGRSKNSSWATEAKALTKPRTCVFPDLNNQESCRALDQVDLRPAGKYQYFSFTSICTFHLLFTPPIYSKSNGKADALFCSLADLLKNKRLCRGANLNSFILINLRVEIMFNVLKRLLMCPCPLTHTRKRGGILLCRFQTSFLQCLSNYSH